MANPPVKSMRSGNVELAVWKHTYEGKVNYSFSFKKHSYNPQKKEWSTKDFFSEADMPNMIVLASRIANKAIKERKPQPKQEQTPQQDRQSAPQQNQPQEDHEEDLY